MTDLGQRIAGVGDALTPTERRLAELVINDPTIVAFGTVADLAERADTSGPTVVRFATKLDFDGYGGLQDYVRQGLTEQLRRPTDRIRRKPDENQAGSITSNGAAAINNVQSTLDELDESTLETMARTIAGAAGMVLVLGNNISAAPGRLLADNLRLLRSGVRQLDTEAASVGVELADVGPGDVLVALDFPRYESATLAAAEIGARSGATILAFTDGPLSPLAALADTWIGVQANAVGPFDSVLSTVALVELLVAEVAVLLRSQATTRLDRIEALWSASRAFHPDPKSTRPEDLQ